MHLKKFSLLFLAVSLCIVLLACGKGNSVLIPEYSGISPSELAATDYSQAAHWLTIPSVIDKPVDVFFVYPSAWQKVNASDPIICKIDNPMMLKNSKLALERDATAFETVGNIFAPYYRQDDAGSTTALPQAEQEKVVGGIPKTDVFAAFEYYIKHYNQGRPYILAGHSQGSIVSILLLSEYMKKNPAVYQRMIAAYMIGCSITPDYLAQNPHLKFAQGPGDTGVIISYNTEAPTIVGKNPVVLPGALAINPLTWTRDETLAAANLNLGTEKINSDGTVVLDAAGNTAFISHYADAKIDKTRGVIICSTADVNIWAPGNAIFGRGIFHSLDYPFYYLNLRENAALRTDNFLNRGK